MCSGASQASADPVEHVASREGRGLDVLNAKHLCQLEVLQKRGFTRCDVKKVGDMAPIILQTEFGLQKQLLRHQLPGY